jgi:hypothetical protein
MTTRDWAHEQLLVLTRDNWKSEISLIDNLTHARDTIIDGSFPVENPVAAMQTVATFEYALSHLQSLLRELHDLGLVSKSKRQWL